MLRVIDWEKPLPRIAVGDTVQVRTYKGPRGPKSDNGNNVWLSPDAPVTTRSRAYGDKRFAAYDPDGRPDQWGNYPWAVFRVLAHGRAHIESFEFVATAKTQLYAGRDSAHCMRIVMANRPDAVMYTEIVETRPFKVCDGSAMRELQTLLAPLLAH